MEFNAAERDAGRNFLRLDWESIDFEKTDQALKVPAPALEKPCPPAARTIELEPKEKWRLGSVSVSEAILSRQSRRKYSAAPLSLWELSFLLYATQGVKRATPKYSMRTVPSGGARHPFETYVFAERVEGVPKGLYRYLPLEHRLCEVREYREGMEEELNAATLGQFWQAAAYFLWAAVPYRTEWRYAGASPKLIALDAGHLCENLYLACEAIGCGTCGIGAYDQKLADAFIGADGQDEFALYLAPVGKVEGA